LATALTTGGRRLLRLRSVAVHVDDFAGLVAGAEAAGVYPEHASACSGSTVAKMDDGTEKVMKAGDFFYVPPGHDSILYTGVAWRHLPPELGFGSGSTCYRRLDEWLRAGMWERLHAPTCAR
jgi:Putative transposase of IS4/5 family (DUF4096)